MVSSSARTVTEYLEQLPDARKSDITKLRTLFRKHLPKGLEEVMNWGMITYQIPLKRFPDTYNKQPLAFAAIASQKHYISIYLMSIYALESERKKFEQQWQKLGGRLDMGKSCVRIRHLSDVPTEALKSALSAVTVEQYLDAYSSTKGSLRKKK